jgi:phosphoserine phosphatase
MMDLALFDLDNTLIAGDSDFEWAQFLIAKGILDRALYEARNIEFYEQYKAGTLDIDVFLDFQLQPLSRYPRALLDTWQREFMSRHILPLVGDKARRWSASISTRRPVRHRHRHQQLRHRTDHPRVRDRASDRHHPGTGERPIHRPAARHAIVSRRQDHPRRGLARSDGPVVEQFRAQWFYSDSQNDLPLLSRVSNPVAVDPDPTLRAHAEAAGWPVISLLG